MWRRAAVPLRRRRRRQLWLPPGHSGIARLAPRPSTLQAACTSPTRMRIVGKERRRVPEPGGIQVTDNQVEPPVHHLPPGRHVQRGREGLGDARRWACRQAGAAGAAGAAVAGSATAQQSTARHSAHAHLVQHKHFLPGHAAPPLLAPLEACGGGGSAYGAASSGCSRRGALAWNRAALRRLWRGGQRQHGGAAARCWCPTLALPQPLPSPQPHRAASACRRRGRSRARPAAPGARRQTSLRRLSHRNRCRLP